MIQFDITNFFDNINIIKKKDGYVTLEKLKEDEIDANLVEFINYVKVHSPVLNIKAFINEYESKLKDIQAVEDLISELLIKFRKEGSILDSDYSMFEIRISCGMKANISLNNLDKLKNWKLSEDFIFDVANILEKKRTILSIALLRFSEFLSIPLKSKEKDEAYFSNPEIAMAFQILYNTTKNSDYNITEKNAGIILKTYAKDSKSITVFMRAVSEFSNINKICFIDKTNKTSATRKKNTLMRTKKLILKIDKSNTKAIAEIDRILKEYLESYSSIY